MRIRLVCILLIFTLTLLAGCVSGSQRSTAASVPPTSTALTGEGTARLNGSAEPYIVASAAAAAPVLVNSPVITMVSATAAQPASPQPILSMTPAAFNPKSSAWLAAPVNNQLAAYNPDGSGEKVLISQPLDLAGTGQTIKATPPGSGAMAAYITSHKGEPDYQDIALNILHLPDGKLVKSIPLYNEKTQPAPWDGKSRLPEQILAFLNPDNLAWSPDGHLLAFTAMLDGPDADIYLYDLQADTLQRLTHEPGQPGALTWSPDGRWLVYQQVENFGTGAGWNVNATWAVDVQKGTSHQLFGSGMRIYHGWTPAGRLIIHPFNFGMPDSQSASDGLVAVDPDSGAMQMLLASRSFPKGAFIQPEYIPGSQWVAVSVQYMADSFLLKIGDHVFGTKGSNQGEIFVLPLGAGQPRSIEIGQGKWGGPVRIACFPNLPECFANWGDRIEAFSPDGVTRTYANETNFPHPSPDGAWLAFYADAASSGAQASKLQLVTPDGKIIRQAADVSDQVYSWRPDSQGLLFFSKSGQICQLPVKVEMPVMCQPEISQVEMIRAVWIQP